MKLKRPHIPIETRLAVIARQLCQSGRVGLVLQAATAFPKTSAQLDFLLTCKFGEETYHLDHDPPLCLREIVDAERGIYNPPGDDPEYLIYRTAEEHRLKTFVRGDGAQLSDAGKRRKEIRRRRKEESLCPRRWPPKGSRPLRGRPF
jgi:hypothetical protein